MVFFISKTKVFKISAAFSIWKSMLTSLHCLILQVFFVIRLQMPQQIQTLPPITDVDPFISCDLMDGRDAFLSQARDKHHEFSSLRRAKYSTMAMLYELHNQGRDNFVYTCNNCKAHVETRWHCVVCEVRNLLVSFIHFWMQNFAN